MKKSMIFIMILGLCGLIQGQTFTSITPKGGSLVLGASYSVQWTYSGIPNGTLVKLVLFKDGAKLGSIVQNIPIGGGSAGARVWTVGNYEGGTALAGTGYRIRIRDMDGKYPYLDSDPPFAITGAQQVVVRSGMSDRPPVLLKFPKLEVTGIDLVPYPDGTVNVVFAYKNTGTAPLPRRSEFAVQPDFRVVVDGRELAKGDLFIPENPPAPPGWGVTTHFGGSLKFPLASSNYVSETGYAYGDFFIGDSITVHINERKAGGMAPSSSTLNLRNMALKFGYDLMISSREYDWATKTLKIQLRIVGKWDQESIVFLAINLANVASNSNFFDLKADPFITVTKKINVPAEEKFADFKIWASIRHKVNKPVWEVDLRNNTVAVSFRRPAR